MFEKQTQHYLLLIVLLFGVYFLATGDVLSGQLWGIGTQTWLWIAVATPVIHQIVVVLLWRAELYHHKMTEWFGDKAFPVFKVIFTIFFIGRPVTLILLGISNANTLELNPAMLMRSFFGMILSYFLTGMLISGSVIDKLMPKNPADIYVDIMLHGILKSEA